MRRTLVYDPRPRSSQGSARGGAETARTTKIFVVDSSRAAARGKQGLHVDVHVARARVISEVFQSVTGLDPPTHFRSYYGLEKTFDNCGRPLTSHICINCWESGHRTCQNNGFLNAALYTLCSPTLFLFFSSLSFLFFSFFSLLLASNLARVVPLFVLPMSSISDCVD